MSLVHGHDSTNLAQPPRTGPGLLLRNHPLLVRSFFSTLAITCDFAAIMLSAVAAGWIYHHGLFGTVSPTNDLIIQGYVVAFLFILPQLLRGEYSVDRFQVFSGQLKQVFFLWNTSLLSALTLAFLTKTSGDISRGSSILLYMGGYCFILLIRQVLVRIVQAQTAAGVIANKRVFLAGFETDVREFIERHEPGSSGFEITASAIIRDAASLQDDLALAAATARILRPDEIFILAPMSQRDAIQACVHAFQRSPASIHFIPDRVFDGHADAQLGRVGNISTMHLVRRPLTLLEIAQKRVFDIAASSVALILFAPVFLMLAIAIKLDSRGPVFFLQRRYGFNQEPFRIFKFRSMTTMEDGRNITQVSKNDARVTRVGRFMRRTNLDELPQLLNVLFGEMSLVGPRPHAMAHDQIYGREIANYARRHNVKPGITGWAQVNGLRGETDTPDKMQRRVEHDLHYIDQWSMLLDIRICFLTILSSKAYRNAG